MSLSAIEAYKEKKRKMEERKNIEMQKNKEKLIKQRIAEAGGKVIFGIQRLYLNFLLIGKQNFHDNYCNWLP